MISWTSCRSGSWISCPVAASRSKRLQPTWAPANAHSAAGLRSRASALSNSSTTFEKTLPCATSTKARSSCRSWRSCWASQRTPVSRPPLRDGPARRQARRGTCLEDRLQIARCWDGPARSDKSHRIGGKDPVAGGVSIVTGIEVAPELDADGGDQHGGQLMVQRCSRSQRNFTKVADKPN